MQLRYALVVVYTPIIYKLLYSGLRLIHKLLSLISHRLVRRVKVRDIIMQQIVQQCWVKLLLIYFLVKRFIVLWRLLVCSGHNTISSIMLINAYRIVMITKHYKICYVQFLISIYTFLNNTHLIFCDDVFKCFYL